MKVQHDQPTSITYHVCQGLIVQGVDTSVHLHDLLKFLGDSPQILLGEIMSTECPQALLMSSGSRLLITIFNFPIYLYHIQVICKDYIEYEINIHEIKWHCGHVSQICQTWWKKSPPVPDQIHLKFICPNIIEWKSTKVWVEKNINSFVSAKINNKYLVYLSYSYFKMIREYLADIL